MQTKMTQKDKKLIVFLAIFVIIVAGGYWGIYPLISGIFSTREEIQDAKALQDVNVVKMSQVSLLEADNQSVEEEMTALKSDFFPMMTSAQVDKYMTGLILDYHLSAYDLSIEMPQEEAQNEPYQYSEKALNADAEEDAGSESTTDTQASDTAIDPDTSAGADSDLFAEDEEIPTGVYMVSVTARVGGDEANIQRLIDDLSVSGQKQHLVSYSWDEESSLDFDEDGAFTLHAERILTMTLNLYMCEE